MNLKQQQLGLDFSSLSCIQCCGEAQTRLLRYCESPVQPPALCGISTAYTRINSVKKPFQSVVLTRGLMKTLHSTCFKYSQVPHAKVSDAKWCEGNEEWRWWCTCTYTHGGVCALSMALQTASSFLHPCPQGEPSCTTDTWLWVLVSDSLSCGQG